jgi:hypothetical protein
MALLTVDPFPSSPNWLLPQQKAVPSVAMPQVWLLRLTLTDDKVRLPVTGAGTLLPAAIVSPFCPAVFAPQQ